MVVELAALAPQPIGDHDALGFALAGLFFDFLRLCAVPANPVGPRLPPSFVALVVESATFTPQPIGNNGAVAMCARPDSMPLAPTIVAYGEVSLTLRVNLSRVDQKLDGITRKNGTIQGICRRHQIPFLGQRFYGTWQIYQVLVWQRFAVQEGFYPA